MKILESAAILPASGCTGALSGKEGQVRWGESAECSGRHLLRLAGGWRGDVVVCPIDIRFPFHLFASFCAYARPARLMRILQPQTESGPSFFFSFFCFVFHVFSCFISFSDYVNLSIFIFFHSPIMCHSHLFIVFPSCVQLLLINYHVRTRSFFLHFAIMYLSFSIENESKQNQKRKRYEQILYKLYSIIPNERLNENKERNDSKHEKK